MNVGKYTMNATNTKVILNITIEILDLLSKINDYSMEFSISLDDLILLALNKLFMNVDYIRSIRC